MLVRNAMIFVTRESGGGILRERSTVNRRLTRHGSSYMYSSSQGEKVRLWMTDMENPQLESPTTGEPAAA
jgi:hypothetical protein